MGRNCVLSNAKPIGVVAAIFSGIQGLIWAVIYFLILLEKYCIFPVGNEQPKTFKHYLVAYISGERCPGTRGALSCVPLTGPEILLPWLVIAVIVNLLLAVSSLALALVLVKCSKENHIAFINSWIVFGLIALIVDAGLTSIFAMDFMKLQDSTCLQDNGLGAIAIAHLLLISTHGILLTISNLAFIIFFLAASIKLYIKYKIRNKEIDLVSDWPSASSENSLFDFYNNKTKNDLVGIVNPIQEYPEYSAKGRWPTLRESSEQSRPPLRAWETRSDLVGSVRRDQALNNNNIIQREDNVDNYLSGTTRARIYARRGKEESSGTTKSLDHVINEAKPRYQKETADLSSSRKFDNFPQGSMTLNGSNTSSPQRNPPEASIAKESNSKASPSPSLTSPAPPPPPALPAAPVIAQGLRLSRPPSFEGAAKFPSTPSPSQEVINVGEPDYTPPVSRKPLESLADALKGSQSKIAMMSLHEAIKSRPPLRPVFSKIKLTTDC